MEHQERGRTSRASSTSSLGREVRCACQYFQSDSLLPERRAMTFGRPSSRNAVHPTTQNPSSREHEYEPIGTPLVNPRTMTPISTAPVVRIIDTDVAPVADSDDSIDLRARFAPGPILEGTDIVVPLDGRIEDSAMETKELAGGNDTSEELESPQQLQDRLEERFFNAATPCTESRTDCEVNTSQVDSVAMEELPLQRGARGLPQRLRSQAGKLRSRLKSMQRPNFSLPIDRLRSEKAKKSSEKSKSASERTKSRSDGRSSATSERAKKSSGESKSARTIEKPTRMERIRSSLPDRPKISFPDRPKFHFPDRSKFHLPERPRFNIKKPNIRMPSLGKSRKAPNPGEVRRRRSDESSGGSRRNIFQFSTYPRLFDRKSKSRPEYATSSPKESRAQSSESSTLPRVRQTVPLGPGWSQKFTDIKYADDEDDEPRTLAERSRPWRRPSLEEPRVSLGLRREDSDDRDGSQRIERLPYDVEYEDEEEGEVDEEEEEEEEEDPDEKVNRARALKMMHDASDISYEERVPRTDPRSYDDRYIGVAGESDVRIEEIDDAEESMKDREAYRAAFMPVDPRYYGSGRVRGTGMEIGESEGEEDAVSSSGMEEDTSARSDREQQPSSGSSYDRRRRGVIEEIDSDEFYLREKGASQDDANFGGYSSREIRDALKNPENVLARETIVAAPKPPQRPPRTRSMRQRKEIFAESYERVAPPARPRRDSRRASAEPAFEYEDESFADSGVSESRHRIVYRAESAPRDFPPVEPLDDIVVVKPMRRKSKSSIASQSLRRSESLAPQPEETLGEEKPVPPSAPPRRRNRFGGTPHPMAEENNEPVVARINGFAATNGYRSTGSTETPIERRPEPPKKPERATSRETLRSLASIKLDRESVESVPIVPPKRPSRSRGASLLRDYTEDDGTSLGSGSIPDIDYAENADVAVPEDTDSRLEYSGYAIIEKREKPPRPPPPRKRRDEKFATAPRPAKVPARPRRSYGTLRSLGSRTASFDAPAVSSLDNLDATAYEKLDSEEESEKDLRSGVVVRKIQDRPLPAPPRPPRSRRCAQKNEEFEDAEEQPEGEAFRGTSEAFASTQTDPLPDDMVIEEEVTRAKLVVSPSRSGSQILVSTERVPSPASSGVSIAGTRSFSQGARAIGNTTDLEELRYSKSVEFTSEPPERTVSQTFGRLRKSPSPARRATAPIVPPLPTRMTLYQDEPVDDFERPEREKSRSPPLPLEIIRRSDEYDDDVDIDARLLSSLDERTSLEEEVERARKLRLAILGNEPLKIASLEVADLRVDRLNVATLEARKITASEIEALVVSASEISSPGGGEPIERDTDPHQSLLRELVAIRSQLELVNSSQDAAIEPRREAERPRETERPSDRQTEHLQLDSVSRDTETRAIFSSIGSTRESRPPLHAPLPPDEAPVGTESAKKDESAASETRSSSRSRSSSPGRTTSPTRLRQTASPVRSLPPVISVTPDTPDVVHSRVRSSEIPQRAVLSYVSQDGTSSPTERTRSSHRSPSPPSSPSLPSPRPVVSDDNRFVAFPASRIPPEFFSLASPSTTGGIVEREPGVVELGHQLFRAVLLASKRAMRHFVSYVVDRIGHEETDTKTREVELALCALLLIIAGLLIVCFLGPRTITHHHHWDYFNPPKL